MHNPVLLKSFTAAGEIHADSFVAIDSQGNAVQANPGSAFILGATDRIAAQAGQCLDVVLSGIAEVMSSAAISAGQFITVDDNGFAVPINQDGQLCAGAAVSSATVGEAVSVLLGAVRLNSEHAGGSSGQAGGGPVNITGEIVTITDGKYTLAHGTVNSDPAPVVKSEDGSITYASNTDYTIDYGPGIVTPVAGGTMPAEAGAKILVDYTYQQ